MNLDDLSETQSDALRRALSYWATHWDWECPTLFGLDQSDFSAISGTWPRSVAERPRDCALAIAGALRELLFGASAPPAVESIIGISKAEASDLLEVLMPRIDDVLG